MKSWFLIINWYLLVQSQEQKRYKKLWNTFKDFTVNFEEFHTVSDVSIVEFEQVNATWVGWVIERSVFQSSTQIMLKTAVNPFMTEAVII